MLVGLSMSSAVMMKSWYIVPLAGWDRVIDGGASNDSFLRFDRDKVCRFLRDVLRDVFASVLWLHYRLLHPKPSHFSRLMISKLSSVEFHEPFFRWINSKIFVPFFDKA